MRLLITKDMPKSLLLSFLDKRQRTKDTQSSARAMALHMSVTRDKNGNAVGLVNRYAKPKDRYPAEKPETATKVGHTASIAAKAANAAESRHAIFGTAVPA